MKYICYVVLQPYNTKFGGADFAEEAIERRRSSLSSKRERTGNLRPFDCHPFFIPCVDVQLVWMAGGQAGSRARYRCAYVKRCALRTTHTTRSHRSNLGPTHKLCILSSANLCQGLSASSTTNQRWLRPAEFQYKTATVDVRVCAHTIMFGARKRPT